MACRGFIQLAAAIAWTSATRTAPAVASATPVQRAAPVVSLGVEWPSFLARHDPHWGWGSQQGACSTLYYSRWHHTRASCAWSACCKLRADPYEGRGPSALIITCMAAMQALSTILTLAHSQLSPMACGTHADASAPPQRPPDNWVKALYGGNAMLGFMMWQPSNATIRVDVSRADV
jgi:hypothetical protein